MELFLQVIITIVCLAAIAGNLVGVKKFKIDSKFPVVISALAFHIVLYYTLDIFLHFVLPKGTDFSFLMDWSRLLRLHSALSLLTITIINVGESLENKKVVSDLFRKD